MFFVGLAIVLLAGICNASFAVPLKWMRVWKWENAWLSYNSIALVLFPWIIVAVFVRHAGELFSSLSMGDYSIALGFGLLWGICQAGFGVAIDMLGIAVALPVIGGIGMVAGALTPVLVQHPAALLGRFGIVLLISFVFLIAGILLYAHAAWLRTGDSGASTTLRGLLLCLFIGIIAGALNIGFSLSTGITGRAEALGNNSLVATYPVWALLLTAGLIPNILYCGYLMKRNGTVALFASSRSRRDVVLAVLMAVTWVIATYSYGLSTRFLGVLGTSTGYIMYVAFTMFFANLFGWMAGEWRSAPPQANRLLWVGMILLLAAITVLKWA
jgi:L-rhamnose-H+ transport protein